MLLTENWNASIYNVWREMHEYEPLIWLFVCMWCEIQLLWMRVYFGLWYRKRKVDVLKKSERVTEIFSKTCILQIIVYIMVWGLRRKKKNRGNALNKTDYLSLLSTALLVLVLANLVQRKVGFFTSGFTQGSWGHEKQ